jgi:hypothetical protein
MTMKNPSEWLHELLTRHKRRDLVGFDVKEVRSALDQDRAAKEAELADLEAFDSDLTDFETLAASFAGGPDNSDNDNNVDDQ